MRKSKFNSAIRMKVLMYIKEGRTVKDVCRLCKITDVTLGRWLKQDPDFNEEYQEAIASQWANIENLKENGVRVYRRDVQRMEEKIKEEKNKDMNGRPLFSNGLRIRYGDIEENYPLEPCIDPKSGMVEYLRMQSGRYIRFSSTVDAFRRRFPAWYNELVGRNKLPD